MSDNDTVEVSTSSEERRDFVEYNNENEMLTIDEVEREHYAIMEIEPIDYGEANKMTPLQFTVIKYVSRYKLKHDNPLIDLYKARQTLDRLITQEENKRAINEQDQTGITTGSVYGVGHL